MVLEISRSLSDRMISRCFWKLENSTLRVPSFVISPFMDSCEGFAVVPAMLCSQQVQVEGSRNKGVASLEPSSVKGDLISLLCILQ